MSENQEHSRTLDTHHFQLVRNGLKRDATKTEQALAFVALAEIAESHDHRIRILAKVQEALTQLRVDVKYLEFDLHATRLERDEARNLPAGAGSFVTLMGLFVDKQLICLCSSEDQVAEIQQYLNLDPSNVECQLVKVADAQQGESE